MPAPIIDSTLVTANLIQVSGRAVPAVAVTLTDVARDEILASEIAGPSGSFNFQIDITTLLETTALLELLANAEGDSGLSPPSLSVVVLLRREEVLFPGWNLVPWAGATGAGTAAAGFAHLPQEAEPSPR